MSTSSVRAITLIGLFGGFMIGSAGALDLAQLTNQDAARGIKGALDQGAASAIAKLGVPGGFLDNPKVKIPLPPALDEIAKVMRMMGRGKDADELVVAMNRAAEQAVPQAKELMIDAVKSMSLEDAKRILTGGDDSVTQFFRAKTEGPLAVKFLPIVKQATDRVGLARKYDQVAGAGSQTRAGQGRCGEHRPVRHPQGVGWPVSHDRRGGARDQEKSRRGGFRDRLRGVRRLALNRLQRRPGVGAGFPQHPSGAWNTRSIRHRRLRRFSGHHRWAWW